MNNSQHHSNFWFGFLIGAGTSAGALYLFGTKQGREKLHDALRLTENIEETVDDVLDALSSTESQPYQSNTASHRSVQTEGQSLLKKVVRIVDLFVSREEKPSSRHYLDQRNT